MYDLFLTHIESLIQLTKRAIYSISGIFTVAIFILIINILSKTYSIILLPVYILLFFIIGLLFILMVRNLNYYQKIKKVHDQNVDLTLTLLEKSIDEANEVKHHCILKSKANLLINAYDEYKKVTKS